MFTVIYSSLHGFITNQINAQLSVGLLAQLVEHCTVIAEVTGSKMRRSFAHSLLNPQFTCLIFIYSRLLKRIKLKNYCKNASSHAKFYCITSLMKQFAKYEFLPKWPPPSTTCPTRMIDRFPSACCKDPDPFHSFLPWIKKDCVFSVRKISGWGR